MAFDPADFVVGVAQDDASAIVRTTRESVEQVRERLPDVVRGGGNVFDPYNVDQIIADDSEEMVSVLSIRRQDGEILCATDHFILSSINEPDQEKMSFAFSLGEPVLFGGAGRRPLVFSYSGFLKDSRLAGPGISAWRRVYDKYLRGERCVQMGAVAVLEYRDQYREGYLMSSNMAYEATRPTVATFSFNLFVIQREI